MKPAEGSTVIGKSVVIRGELSGSEDLFIDGTIEGKIAMPASRVTIGPNASVRADIFAQDIVVLGKVEGNIKAASRLEMRHSGSVIGDIIAHRLSVEESATIRGKVELTNEARPVTATKA